MNTLRNKLADLISIIVPIYNVENYLNKCLSSITQQTYTNIEILLIDDGSTDRSGEICKKWTQKDSRIKYFLKENGGVSSARNRGLQEAKGEYIGFVDADDWISPNMYESLYTQIIKNECDIAICSRTRVIDGEEIHYQNKESFIFTHGKIDMRKLACIYDMNSIYNKLYNKSLLKSIYFPTNMTYGEDLYIVPDILNNSRKGVYTSEGLYYYFDRKDSASYNQWDINKLQNNIDATLKLYYFLKKKKVYNQIAFDMVIGAFANGCIKNQSIFYSQYKSFFKDNMLKCLTRIKCLILYICPQWYFKLKRVL